MKLEVIQSVYCVAEGALVPTEECKDCEFFTPGKGDEFGDCGYLGDEEGELTEEEAWNGFEDFLREIRGKEKVGGTD